MLHLLLALGTAVAGVVLSRPVPTEELLQDRFALGQKYYAANDHENSVQVFSQIEATPNYALLDVDRIEVAIDDLVLPLRVAATYQLGNSYRNVGRTLLERSRNLAAEGDSAGALLRRGESLAAFDRARGYYRALVDDEARSPRNLRVMSQYQIVRASYQTEDYPGVVDETRILLERFPGSEYEDAALYDRGWAYFYMGQYREAVATFEQLLQVTRDELKRDRALFQMGESHAALGEMDRAREAYARLVSQYDFARMSQKELQEMRTERLRGLVRETTRELVAKAQIRTADSYAEEGRVDEAIAAYWLVPERFPQEALLVQKSYDNMATMVLQHRGVDPGVRVLRQAIEQVEDGHFRGRAQLRIAGIFYRAGRFREAIAEYEVYRRAYGDVAPAIGVGLDEVLFSQAEAWRELARAGEASALDEARAAYARLLAQHPGSARRPEATYGLGHVEHTAGRLDSAAARFAAVVETAPRSAVAPHALSWWARTAFQQGRGDEAVALYRRLLDEYPDAALASAAWKDLGLVYKGLGRTDDAVAALARVERGDEVWPKVQAEAADLLLAAGRLDEIEGRLHLPEALEAAAAAGDRESVAELHYVLGRVARERQDGAAQIDHFSRTLAQTGNPDLATYGRFFRGLAYYQSGAAADAAGDSLEGAARLSAAVADLDTVLAGSIGTDVRLMAFRTRGVALTRLGRSQDAVRAYEELIAAAPSAEERAEFELMLMELYYDLGRLDVTESAARHLTAADFREPEGGFAIRDRAYFVLVSVLLEREGYAEAQETAAAALRRFPSSPNRPALLMASARALFLEEEYEAAARAFEQYLAGYPTGADATTARYQLGYAREVVGDYEGAARAFRELADAAPGDPLVPDALYRAGESLYNASHFEEALGLFLRVVDEHPGSDAADKALYSASWTYLDLDREAESVAAMERLVRQFPDSGLAGYAQFSIGDYYYSKKEFALARRAYEQVVAQFPSTEEAAKARALLTDVREDLASQQYEGAFGEFQKGNYAAAARGFEGIYADYPESYSALAALANKGVALEHLGNSQEARQTYERVLAAAADNPEARDISNFARLRLENL